MQIRNSNRRRSTAAKLALPVMSFIMVTSMVVPQAFAGSNGGSRSSSPPPSRSSSPSKSSPSPSRTTPYPSSPQTTTPSRSTGYGSTADSGSGSGYKYGSGSPSTTPKSESRTETPNETLKPSGGYSQGGYASQKTTVTPIKPAPSETRADYPRSNHTSSSPTTEVPRAAAPRPSFVPTITNKSTSDLDRAEVRNQVTSLAPNISRPSIPIAGVTAATAAAATAAAARPNYGSGQEVPLTTYNGKAYQKATTIGDKITVVNTVTGKTNSFDLKTNSGTKTNKTGTSKNDYTITPNGYQMNKTTFTGADGVVRPANFTTKPVVIATKSGSTYNSERYVAPTRYERTRTYTNDQTSSTDYLLWYLIVRDSMNHNQGGGYYGGSGGGGFASGGGGDIGMQAPPRIPTGFEIEWGDHFAVVPAAYKGAGTLTYKNPAEAVAAYVTLDIINDNTETPAAWKRFVKKVTFGGIDPTHGAKPFEVEAGARIPITQQTTDMAAAMIKSTEIDMSKIIDEKTGELVKDEKGNVPRYYFIVDPANQNQVKDSETQSNCSLATASVLLPVEAAVSGDIRLMKVRIVSGGKIEGSCKTKQTVMVDQTDLEEMNNILASQVDEALKAIPKMSKPVFN